MGSEGIVIAHLIKAYVVLVNLSLPSVVTINRLSSFRNFTTFSLWHVHWQLSWGFYLAFGHVCVKEIQPFLPSYSQLPKLKLSPTSYM